MPRAVAALALLPAVATACGEGPPPPLLVVEELESPAGVGSGEPFLSSWGDTVLMSWLETVGGAAHELRLARLAEGRWTTPTLVAESDHFFVNWADFPSVAAGPDGSLWAHWLERGAGGGYDYGVRIVHSTDGGATWSKPWTPHEDATATEHGFVSTAAVGDALGFLWLDGRRFEPGPDGAASQEMALYFRAAEQGGPAGPETLVDARVCDCCQTDMAVTARGPVAVYRDRSPEEIRDIRIIHYRDDAWTKGSIVHEDGWETAACPVNGPAVAAFGEHVVVAWFSAAGGVPRVRIAFSDDAGETFDRPVDVDDGNPAGRVDLVLLEDGAALVSWLERGGGELAEVRVRPFTREGRPGEGVSVSLSSGERASGFPRLARAGDGSVIVAWTDVAELAPRVRVARIGIEPARLDPVEGEAP
ncbi:MAG TPA: hypothetical protein VMM35_10650 [Longimicrobiales bacterium]|nr:hypothetical protein [Longimicrobiales bacterium]